MIMSCARLFLNISAFWVIGLNVISSSVMAQEKSTAEPFMLRTETKGEYSSLLADPFKYKGDPIIWKSLRIWPNLTVGQEFSDNILMTESDQIDDFATVVHASFDVWTSFRRHNFKAALEAERRQYWDLKDESVNNYTMRLEGDFEAKRGFNIPIQLLYRDSHIKRKDQRRSSVNEITQKPLNVKSLQTRGGFVYKPNRLALSLLGDYKQIRLENGTLLNNSLLRRDTRDVNIPQFILRSEYEGSGIFQPFVEIRYSQENYINEAVGSASRDNNLLRYSAGTNFNHHNIFSGFIGLGWESRRYDDSAVDDVEGVFFDSTLIWSPSEKNSIEVGLTQETTEDNQILAGFEKKVGKIFFSHELKSNLFSRFGITYEKDNFDEINREDENLELSSNILYIVGPSLQMSANYQYTSKDSSIAGLGADNNTFLLKAKLSM